MNDAVIKLKQLLSSQYGKELEFRRLIDLSKVQVDAEPIIHGSDLYVPIMVQDQFLGTAIIHQGWELTPEMKKNAIQLVRTILEPELYIEYLSRRKTNIQSSRSINFSGNNLSLFTDSITSDAADNSPNSSLDDSLGIFRENEETEVYGDNNQKLSIVESKNLITSLLHLQGHDNSLIKKIALQIHDFSARWAFVSFEDICSEISTEMDICNLGGMTLYFENVENLSVEHQGLLAEYLKSPRSLSEPLILTGSTLSLKALSERLVHPDLNKDIQVSHLEIERAPLDSNMLRELLDLFFHRDEFQDLH